MRSDNKSPFAPSEGVGAASSGAGRDGGFVDLDAALAGPASGVVVNDVQNALLASIETRLTEEVRRLVVALDQFSGRAQLIGKELPESAQFGKAVTGFLALLSFQFAYALRKDLDKPILFDDGAEYLRGLGLTLEQAFREVSLDGRRYSAVACVDNGLDDIDKRAGRGDER